MYKQHKTNKVRVEETDGDDDFEYRKFQVFTKYSIFDV